MECNKRKNKATATTPRPPGSIELEAGPFRSCSLNTGTQPFRPRRLAQRSIRIGSSWSSPLPRHRMLPRAVKTDKAGAFPQQKGGGAGSCAHPLKFPSKSNHIRPTAPHSAGVCSGGDGPSPTWVGRSQARREAGGVAESYGEVEQRRMRLPHTRLATGDPATAHSLTALCATRCVQVRGGATR